MVPCAAAALSKKRGRAAGARATIDRGKEWCLTGTVDQSRPGTLDATAAMARLRVGAHERARLEAELARIVDYFALLAEADVDHLPPTTHPLSSGTRLRDDRVSTLPTCYDPVSAAPDRDERFIVVPNVL